MNIYAVLFAAYAADLAFGDPERMPHPVRLIGKLISETEKTARFFMKSIKGELAGGFVVVAFVCLCCYFVPYYFLQACRSVGEAFFLAAEIYLCYSIIAVKSLRDAAYEVYRSLKAGDLAAARRNLAMIVGRDTDGLDEKAIVRAAVESVAENSSDGVTAPLFYMAVGGAPLGFMYKGINTMDSMLGYKNERYLYFGRAAARLDDAANFVPARITGIMFVAAAFLAGYDWKNSLRILLRDGSNHSSPNAGRPEAACAGALGIRLGGDSFYSGKKVIKPYMGEDVREPCLDDIPKACRLLYVSSFLCLLLFCSAGFAAYAWVLR